MVNDLFNPQHFNPWWICFQHHLGVTSCVFRGRLRAVEVATSMLQAWRARPSPAEVHGVFFSRFFFREIFRRNYWRNVILGTFFEETTEENICRWGKINIFPTKISLKKWASRPQHFRWNPGVTGWKNAPGTVPSGWSSGWSTTRPKGPGKSLRGGSWLGWEMLGDVGMCLEDDRLW